MRDFCIALRDCKF